MRAWGLTACALLALTGCQSAAERASADDAYCASIGAKPGSDTYAQCRITLRQERAVQHQAGFRAAAEALQGAGDGMARAQQSSNQWPRPLNCTSSPLGGGSVSTTCY